MKLSPTLRPKTFTINALTQGLRIFCLKSLESFTNNSHCQSISTSPSDLASSSIPSSKLKACEKAPGISPTNLSLKEALGFHDPPAWLDDARPKLWPSQKPAWLTALTFFLLRASSSFSSRERAPSFSCCINLNCI